MSSSFQNLAVDPHFNHSERPYTCLGSYTIHILSLQANRLPLFLLRLIPGTLASLLFLRLSRQSPMGPLLRCSFCLDNLAQTSVWLILPPPSNLYIYLIFLMGSTLIIILNTGSGLSCAWIYQSLSPYATSFLSVIFVTF